MWRQDNGKRWSRRGTAWLMALTFLVLSGCTTAAPPQNAAEELCRYEWIPKTAEGRLTFSGGSLQLSVQQGENRIALNGVCFTDEDTLTVLSEQYGTVVMQYELAADQLHLTYFDKQATFVKGNSFTGGNA